MATERLPARLTRFQSRSISGEAGNIQNCEGRFDRRRAAGLSRVRRTDRGDLSRAFAIASH